MGFIVIVLYKDAYSGTAFYAEKVERKKINFFSSSFVQWLKLTASFHPFDWLLTAIHFGLMWKTYHITWVRTEWWLLFSFYLTNMPRCVCESWSVLNCVVTAIDFIRKYVGLITHSWSLILVFWTITDKWKSITKCLYDCCVSVCANDCLCFRLNVFV